MLKKVIAIIGTTCTLFTSLTVFAGPTLSIQRTGSTGPVHPGDTVQVMIRMSDLQGQAAAGFQGFVEFDPLLLQFQNAAYTSAPFGLAVIVPVTANGTSIDVASGINQFAGQTSTTQDAMLVFLTFTALKHACDLQTMNGAAVRFRLHQPPSRITNASGNDILPLTLVDLTPMPATCPTDFTADNVVSVNDLLTVINNWGMCSNGGVCCPGDSDGSGNVNVNDLLAVINTWGPCNAPLR